MLQPVTVVIPIHKPRPDADEILSLSQCLNVLHRHPIAFVAPAGLDVAWYEAFCAGHGEILFERFGWSGFRAYSALLLSPDFYARFLAYRYMLVYHLDAYVFRDELDEWCRTGVDYAGAVVFNRDWMPRQLAAPHKKWSLQPPYFANGGFSLRKTATFHANARLFKPLIRFLFNRREVFLEDIFWCQRLRQINPFFRMLPWDDALRFGVEYHENYTDPLPPGVVEPGRLPFGCHGWIQYHRDFWKPHIQG